MVTDAVVTEVVRSAYIDTNFISKFFTGGYSQSMTPAESDYLLRLAALSLSFVGFSAIVVSLRGALGNKPSERHLRLVRFYIEGGLVVTGLGLLPALLNLLGVPEMTLWRVASAAAAAIFAYVLLTQFQRRRAVEGHFPQWVVTNNLISIFLVLCLCLNVAGFPFQPGVGPYAVALTWALIAIGFAFVRTIEIFLQPESRE